MTEDVPDQTLGIEPPIELKTEPEVIELGCVSIVFGEFPLKMTVFSDVANGVKLLLSVEGSSVDMLVILDESPDIELLVDVDSKVPRVFPTRLKEEDTLALDPVTEELKSFSFANVETEAPVGVEVLRNSLWEATEDMANVTLGATVLIELKIDPELDCADKASDEIPLGGPMLSELPLEGAATEDALARLLISGLEVTLSIEVGDLLPKDVDGLSEVGPAGLEDEPPEVIRGIAFVIVEEI